MSGGLLREDAFSFEVRRLEIEMLGLVEHALGTAGLAPTIPSATRTLLEETVRRCAAGLAEAAEAVIEKQRVKLRFIQQEYLSKLETVRAAYETRLRDALVSAEGQKAAAVEVITRKMEALEQAHRMALGIQCEAEAKVAAAARADKPIMPDEDEAAARKLREMAMQEELEELRLNKLRLQGMVDASQQSLQAMQHQIKELVEDKESLFNQLVEMRRLHGELSVREAITAHNLADARLVLQQLTGRASGHKELSQSATEHDVPNGGDLGADTNGTGFNAPNRMGGAGPADFNGQCGQSTRDDGAPSPDVPARRMSSDILSTVSLPPELHIVVQQYELQSCSRGSGLTADKAPATRSLEAGEKPLNGDTRPGQCARLPASTAGCPQEAQRATPACTPSDGKDQHLNSQRPLSASGSKPLTSSKSACAHAAGHDPPASSRTNRSATSSGPNVISGPAPVDGTGPGPVGGSAGSAPQGSVADAQRSGVVSHCCADTVLDRHPSEDGSRGSSAHCTCADESGREGRTRGRAQPSDHHLCSKSYHLGRSSSHAGDSACISESIFTVEDAMGSIRRRGTPSKQRGGVLGDLALSAQRSAQSTPRVLPQAERSPRALTAPIEPPVRWSTPLSGKTARALPSDALPTPVQISRDPAEMSTRASSVGVTGSHRRLLAMVTPTHSPRAAEPAVDIMGGNSNGNWGGLPSSRGKLGGGGRVSPSYSARRQAPSEINSAFFSSPRGASHEVNARADALRGLEERQREDTVILDAISGIFSSSGKSNGLTHPGLPGGRSVSLPRHMLRTVKDGL